MDLICVENVVRPRGDDEFPPWQRGDRFVAGGTWLFSEPQPDVSRLIDLSQLPWVPFVVRDVEVEIGANCTYTLLEASDWLGLPGKDLFRAAIRSLSSSFKTYGLATVGGNLCLAYAKGMMGPVMVSLGATYELVSAERKLRRVAAADFQTGVCLTVLQPGEYLRRVLIPRPSLSRRAVLKRASFTATSHVTAMVIATALPEVHEVQLTLSGALAYPVRIALDSRRPPHALIDEVCAKHPMMNDAHGSPSYRKALLHALAADAIREVTA
jgi:CO/xanthine dehydrogenase FAD-binding subunit